MDENTSVQSWIIFGELFYKHNSNNTFTIELGQSYDLDGHWTIELLEFKCLFGDVKPDMLHVHCDICEESLAVNQHVPLLRVISIPRTKYKRFETSFNVPFAIKVMVSKLQRLKIYITDGKGQLVSFTKEPVYMTVRIKQHGI